MNNNKETRSTNNNPTKSKNIWLILIAIFVGILAAIAIFFMGVYISSSSKSSNSHVSSESSSKKLSSEKTSTSEETSSSEVASSQEATQPTDDGYNYILVFADGTTRLSRTAPTSEYWQEGTSSAASNGHPGRTTYNQLSFKQMGGETGTGTSEDDRDEYMKDWNEDYDNDSQAMMEKSIPYHG